MYADALQFRYLRFSGENLEKNKALYQRVAALAEKHGCTPGQLALSWVSSQGGDVVPIPGTTKVANLDQNIESLNVKLGPKELEEVAAAVPKAEVAGDRYSEGFNKITWKYTVTPTDGILDSETLINGKSLDQCMLAGRLVSSGDSIMESWTPKP